MSAIKDQTGMQVWLDAWATAYNISNEYSTLADFPIAAREELIAAFRNNEEPTQFKSKW
jgi:hypothetical protein